MNSMPGPFASLAALQRCDCVPAAVLEDLVELDASKVVLLGGPATLSSAVEQLTPCGR